MAEINVQPGQDLQAALNAAKPGDEVVIAAGATYTGNFVLPVRAAGGAVITVRSSTPLPLRRVGPDDAALMPTLVSGNGGSALTANGTAGWLLIGLRFLANAGGAGNVVELQDVKNVTLDRTLFVAPETGQRRGIAGNGEAVTLTRSYWSRIWAPTLQDSQAFCAWDGAGPYSLTDNYLEAASEPFMFGGASSRSADRIPSDILVESNLITKPIEWKGTAKAVKNLGELKAARRVTIRGNTFRNNWTDAQAGYAILFTARNDEGSAPWSVVEDVLFEHNVIEGTENGINILGYDSYKPSGRTTRVTIRHNLIRATGVMLQVGAEAGTVVWDHNTADQGYNAMTLYTGQIMLADGSVRNAAFAVESFTVTNSLMNHNEYGVFGEGSIGLAALTSMTRAFSWANDVIAGEGGWGRTYPPTTQQPATADYKTNFDASYHLVAASKYLKAGTDGLDLGVVWDGAPPPPPPPPPPFTVVTSGAFQIDVFYMDTAVKRSDRNGALIRWQLYSTQPVKAIELTLVGSGETPQETQYKVQQGADGRYYGGAIIRPTINGTWPLQIKATDARGNVGVAICKPGITVTP